MSKPSVVTFPVRNVDGYGHDVPVKCKHTDTVRMADWRLWCRTCGALGEFRPVTISGELALLWSVPKRDWSGEEADVSEA